MISLRLFISLDLLQSTPAFSLYKVCNPTELHTLSVSALTVETTAALANMLEVSDLLVADSMFLSDRMLCDTGNQLHVTPHQPIQEALIQFGPAYFHVFYIPDNKWVHESL